MFYLKLTWKDLFYDVSEVADNVQYFLIAQVLIGYMWCVISEKQHMDCSKLAFFLFVCL